MPQETYTETAYKSFEEETLGALLDKEFFLVALGTNENTVKIAASGDTVIGVLFGRMTPDSKAVTVRLFGKGGTCKVKAGGAIAKDARVIWGAGGKVLTLPGTAGAYRTFGRKLGQGSAANNDVIEILDTIEPVTVA